MNYFELFEIPVSLSVHAPLLKQKFYALSRQYHPDFFAQALESEQAEALEKSSMINKAYQIFQNKNETIKYVLHLKGLLEEEEKYQLAPDFLMEMMELNEQLTDAKMENNQATVKALKQKIYDIERDIYFPVKNSVENYTEAKTTTDELLKVKEYYYKKKYLERILAAIK